MWVPVVFGCLLAYWGASYRDALMLFILLTGLQASVEIAWGNFGPGSSISEYEFYVMYTRSGRYGIKCPWARYMVETTLIFTLLGMIVFAGIGGCKIAFHAIMNG